MPPICCQAPYRQPSVGLGGGTTLPQREHLPVLLRMCPVRMHFQFTRSHPIVL